MMPGDHGSTTSHRTASRVGAIAAILVFVLSSCSGDGSEAGLTGAATAGSPLDEPLPAPSLPAGADAEVTVDLGAPRAERSRYGVLHWDSIAGVPPRLVEPLEPTVIRVGFAPEDLEEQLDRFETVNVLLSDGYGYPPSWPVAPYVDSGQWVAWVQSVLDDPVVIDAMAESPERLIFEPWNEPDIPTFWDGTLDQASDLWLETEAVIRATYPDAQIGGPSYAFFRTDAITAFLDRCAAVGCRVDYLIWHGFQTDIPSLRDDIDESGEFITGGAYDAVGLQGLLINEYPFATLNLLPAENLGALEAFEDADLFGSARACWGNSHTLDEAVNGPWTNCGEGLLNGFVTPDWEPRAVWWVYERFAAGLAGRVETTASDPDHVTVVGSGDGDSVSVLVGHLADVELEASDASREPIDIAVSINGIDRACVDVTIRAIPDSRDDPLVDLPVVARDVYRVAERTHRVLLAGVPAHEVRVIDVSALDC